jgi:hypothetical protein
LRTVLKSGRSGIFAVGLKGAHSGPTALAKFDKFSFYIGLIAIKTAD